MTGLRQAAAARLRIWGLAAYRWLAALSGLVAGCGCQDLDPRACAALRANIALANVAGACPCPACHPGMQETCLSPVAPPSAPTPTPGPGPMPMKTEETLAYESACAKAAARCTCPPGSPQHQDGCPGLAVYEAAAAAWRAQAEGTRAYVVTLADGRRVTSGAPTAELARAVTEAVHRGVAVVGVALIGDAGDDLKG